MVHAFILISGWMKTAVLYWWLYHKEPVSFGVGEAVRPRTKPKPKVKSQTVSGIALPGLADALKKKKVAAKNKVGPLGKQLFLSW